MTPRRRLLPLCLALVSSRTRREKREEVYSQSFHRQFSAALCPAGGRGERERGRLEEVDLIGPASSEFLIRDISFRASFRCNERET